MTKWVHPWDDAASHPESCLCSACVFGPAEAMREYVAGLQSDVATLRASLGRVEAKLAMAERRESDNLRLAEKMHVAVTDTEYQLSATAARLARVEAKVREADGAKWEGRAGKHAPATMVCMDAPLWAAILTALATEPT